MIVASAKHNGYLTDAEANVAPASVNSLANDESNVVGVNIRVVSVTPPSNQYCKPFPAGSKSQLGDSQSNCGLSVLFSNGMRRYGWPTIVNDCSSGRSIISPSDRSYAAVGDLVSSHASAAVYGSKKGTDVSMIWATCEAGTH